MHNTVSFDDFEDADELSELPPVTGLPGQHGTNTSQEKTVRRRSSKACDQCRKSKCKCERTGDGESCKNCIMMNTRLSHFPILFSRKYRDLLILIAF
jgi:hypothetical protein